MGILAVILGIIAILSALLATFMFGITGLIITVVLAAAAIALSIIKRSRDKKGGIPGIVIAVIALLIGFGMNSFWSGLFTTMHDKAVEYMPDSLWAQVSENTSHGLMGIASNVPTDQASINKLVEEMNELSKLAETENK